MKLSTPKNLMYVIFIVLSFLITGCNEPFEYQVTVYDQVTGDAIENALVTIEGSGAPQRELTDIYGFARIFINAENAGSPGTLRVEKTGYDTCTQGIDLTSRKLPAKIYLQQTDVVSTLPAIAMPQPTNTIAPSPTKTTESPAATSTLVPIPTQPPATATPLVSSPTQVGGVFAIGLGICDSAVYAGPDNSNQILGDLKKDETAEIISRTAQSEWLKISTERDITGWINPDSVQIISGNVADVPVDPVWSGSVMPPTSCSSRESGPDLPPSGCVTVHIEKQVLSTDYFDDVLFSWSNVTESAQYLIFQIRGTVDDETTTLLPEERVEPTAEYLVGRWRFEDGGFAHGSEFDYLVTAVDTQGNDICSVSGHFNQR